MPIVFTVSLHNAEKGFFRRERIGRISDYFGQLRVDNAHDTRNSHLLFLAELTDILIVEYTVKHIYTKFCLRY